MIVIFDRQHYGKPGKPADRGAAYDLDGDGVVESQEQEANITPLYYLPAKAELERLGHSVYLLDSGWYPDRHKQANAIATQNAGKRVAYVACHINAGGGSYSAVLHDERSRGGAGLASAVSNALLLASLSGVTKHLVHGSSATNVWKRGFTTIAGIYSGPSNIAGICFEPFFLDNPKHQWLATVEGGQAVGKALAIGLANWGKQ